MNFISSHWSTLALLNAFLIGAYVSALIAFIRWRLGKKVIARKFWDNLVEGYIGLERSLREAEAQRGDVHTAYDNLSGRLERSTSENQALQSRLLALEAHLDSVTDEATTLVSGLRHNEQQWSEAEALRTELQNQLEAANAHLTLNSERFSSVSIANEELARRLQSSNDRLTAATTQVEQLRSELGRRSNLEAHLHEALDRDRQQMITLARLEDRYRATHHQLVEANSRAGRLEQQLQAATSFVRSEGVFDRPVPIATPTPIAPTAGEIKLAQTAPTHDLIDLRSPNHPPAPRTTRRHVAAGARHARSHGRLPD